MKFRHKKDQLKKLNKFIDYSKGEDTKKEMKYAKIIYKSSAKISLLELQLSSNQKSILKKKKKERNK